jgi:hypothetical protein
MSVVDWVPLQTEAVHVGDLVSTDAGGMPIYRVVAVEDGNALLQGDGSPDVRAMPLERLHWKLAQGHSAPAR